MNQNGKITALRDRLDRIRRDAPGYDQKRARMGVESVKKRDPPRFDFLDVLYPRLCGRSGDLTENIR